MRTRHLGFRVRAFVPGEGWKEDRFTLRHAAIEAAQLSQGTAEEITREQTEASTYGPAEWIEDEQFTVIWEPA